MSNEVLWTPPADVRETSRIGHYLRWLERERGLTFADYEALWQWSVTDLAGFWRSIWDYFEVIAHTEPTATLTDGHDAGRALVPAARRSTTPSTCCGCPARADDDPVVLAYSQTRSPVTLSTAASCATQVRRVAAGLRRLGRRAGRPGRGLRAEHPGDRTC